MSKTKFAKSVAIHFCLSVVFIFLALGATGLGFKNNWEAFDYIYFILSVGVASILTFPIWLISTIVNFPNWALYFLIPLQIAVSYYQVKLFVVLRKHYLKNT